MLTHLAQGLLGFMLQPREWGIADNATFDHGGELANLIEAANCKMLYLLPYSPDLNHIEKCWAWLKSQVRNQLRDSANLRNAIDFVLKQAAS